MHRKINFTPAPRENGVRGEVFCELRNYNGRITTPEIGIDIVCDHTGFKIPCIADPVLGAARNVQIFRENELHAFYRNIPATGVIMSWDGEGFHAPGMFIPIGIHFCKDHCQRHPLSGADILNGQI